MCVGFWAFMYNRANLFCMSDFRHAVYIFLILIRKWRGSSNVTVNDPDIHSFVLNKAQRSRGWYQRSVFFCAAVFLAVLCCCLHAQKCLSFVLLLLFTFIASYFTAVERWGRPVAVTCVPFLPRVALPFSLTCCRVLGFAAVGSSAFSADVPRPHSGLAKFSYSDYDFSGNSDLVKDVEGWWQIWFLKEKPVQQIFVFVNF